MTTLLKIVLFFAALLALGIGYSALWRAAMRRLCLTRGYVYRSEDPQAEPAARKLVVGDGSLNDFVSGARRGHSFVFCERSWDRTGGSRTRTFRSSNVLVELQRPVPSLAIRYIGQGLPPVMTLDYPSIAMPDDPVFGRYHVSGLDANAVRAVLTPRLRAAVAAAVGRDLLTDGQTMLWTRPGSLGWPTQLAALLDEAVTAAEGLEEAALGFVGDPSAPRSVPKLPIRRRRFGSFLTGVALGVPGACLLVMGVVFGVAALYAGALDAAATSRGLVLLFAGAVASAVLGALLVFLGRRAWRRG